MVYLPDTNFRNALINKGFGSCITGDSIDASCSLVINASSLDVTFKGIVNLTGVSVFINLYSLTCSHNNLSFLPTLPASVTNLYCDYNQLNSLPSLPVAMTELNCNDNNLTSLPNLPSTLIYLNCAGNQLTYLPTLPISITYINCTFNQLDSLPSLPSFLNAFFCFANLLTSLPVLPGSLTYFNCSSNNLTSLPSLPSSLYSFDCSDNQISNIAFLPASLGSLNCGGNQLTFLPALPNSLTGLICSSNQLTFLPFLPTTMTSLNCGGNWLTYLPPLPPTLVGLDCSWNQFATLPSLPPALINFFCNNNHLISLPELKSPLDKLWCYNNPNLTCFPKLPNLSQLKFYSTAISCIPNYANISVVCNPPLSSFPLCDLFNNNGCASYWNISGKVYSDLNNNCTPEINEPKLANLKLLLYDSAGNLLQQTITGGGGIYSFDTDTGTYTYTIDTANIPVLVTCPASVFQTSILTSVDSMDYDMDFGMQCKPGFDVGVNAIVITSGIFRRAFNATVNIKAGDMSNKYGLHCSSGINGTVRVVINGDANYVSASPGSLIPVVNGDTLTYSISDFGSVDFNSDFRIIVQTDTFAILGSQICFDVTVTPIAGDINPLNNDLQSCFTVTSSYDPNEKSVYPANRIDDKNGSLTYTINFQNTGTAPALHIYILDTLDAAIDENSFELLAYSFEPQVQIIGNVVRFNFPNINLSDSVTNEPASHGYVQYRVKLKDSLALGTLIANTSYIYFDFNSPVQTNTVIDTLTDCNNIAAVNFSSLTLCYGDTLFANVLPMQMATTEWYLDSAFVSNNQSIALSNISSGNHTLKLTVTSAYCSQEYFSNILVNPLPTVQLGNDMATCNTPLTLDAGAGNISYQWSNGETTQSIVSNTSSTYTVTVTNNYGCSNSDTTIVTIYPLPVVNLGNDTSTCNLPVVLNAGINNVSYLWSTGKSTKKITVHNSGSFSVVVTDTNGCSNSDSIKVTINPLPTVQLGNDTSTCSIPVAFDAGAGNISYQWSSGETTQTIIANATANYSVVVTDTNGCSNADTINITINPLPTQPTITQNLNVLISSAATGNQWLMNGSLINGATDTTYMVTVTGWYSVQVTDVNGCTNMSDSVYMDLSGISDLQNPSGVVLIPNPATTEFEVRGLKFESNDEIIIINAMGKTVYQLKISQPTSNLKLQTSNYGAGIYFVNIKTSKSNVVLKLLKN